MFYSSRKASSSTSRKQNSMSMASKRHSHRYSDGNKSGNDKETYDDGNKSGNDTDFGSAELLSTSREDLSPSRCSCQSGGSNVAVRNEIRDVDNEHFWSGNLRLEFDNNGGSDDEQLKDELLRIFDRERLGLETYFKQKTENILAGYRRKQYEWEEKIRSERMEYEKTLAQDKIEIQQNYISEMAKITKQFNQERLELESHYKKQIDELSQQFEFRKKEMDATIVKERTELKERLEAEYQAMLKSQKSADQQRYNQQIMDVEETYKRNLLEQEQKLKDSFFEGELSGRRLQSDMEAKFEQEKSIMIAEWKKRVELLEVELGKEKDRGNREERKASEYHRNEITQKDIELEKLRQVIETLTLELSHKEKAAKEHEVLQQNIFLRGCEALPGKLREDFEKLLAAHREKLEKNLRKEQEGRNIERDARMALERETLEKQLKVERDQMNLDLEKERVEIRHSIREKEEKMRHEIREETERMRTALESEREKIRNEAMKEQKEIIIKEKETRDVEIQREKEILREQVRNEFIQQQQETLLREKELLRDQIKAELMNEKQAKDERTQSRFIAEEGKKSKEREQENEEFADGLEGIRSHRDHSKFETEQTGKRSGSGRDEDEVWDASQKRKHTKQWVEGQYQFQNYKQGYKDDSTGAVDQFEIENKGGHGRQGYSEQEGNHDSTESTGENKSNKELLKREDTGGCQKSDVFRNKDGHFHPTNTSKDPEYNILRLREENEGLKAKVCALQENISLHECFKMEASDEVQRLRNANKDLKMKLESLKDEEEVKKVLQEYKLQIKNYEKQLKENEKKIKEYEDICAEYERSLQKCREKILVIDNDRESTSVARSEPRGDDRKHRGGSKAGRNHKSGLLRDQPREDIIANISQDGKTELERVVPNLEEKINSMEKKISEISVTNQQINTDSMKKVKLSSDLEKLRTQNKVLVNKFKNIQWQLQAMVDKLKKKKKKIAKLKDENVMLKASHQRDISVLQQKLEYSNQIVSRLQDEFSTESSHISRLREEISNINKRMIEERVCEQRMIRARSIEEIEKLRDLDNEKIDLQRKLNDVKAALDGYSERLKHKLSYSETTNSQLSLNTSTTLVRDLQLTESLQALEASRKASHRQNERLQHEKNELQILMSSLCKSKGDSSQFGGFHTHKEHQLSPCSPISSLSSSISSSCMSSLDGGFESGLGTNTKFSSTFSIFD